MAGDVAAGDDDSRHDAEIAVHVFIESLGGECLTIVEPLLVCLPPSKQASAKCGISLWSAVAEVHLRARLMASSGECLCDSGPISLRDPDWYCCGSFGADRLLMLVKECSSGWVLTFDVKESASDMIPILKSIHLLQSSSSERPALDQGGKAPASDLQDAPGSDSDDCCSAERLHPTHALLLRSFRNPGSHLLDPGTWNALASGSLTSTPGAQLISGLLGDVDDGATAGRREDLASTGHCRLRGLPWGDAGVSLQDMADTIDNLGARGLPPVFIFMYDQAWRLLAQLFDVADRILGGGGAEMALSVFAWSLAAGGGGRKVGGNFAVPHRDTSNDNCHTEEGRLTRVTTWVALVPVTAESGCMRVLPAARDPWLERPGSPRHLRPEEALPALPSLGEALPCGAGDVLMWRADLVHWGSSCAEGVASPRKSLSTSFLLPGHGQHNCISRAALGPGLGMEARLRIVLRALLTYKVHYPSFEGLDLSGA